MPPPPPSDAVLSVKEELVTVNDTPDETQMPPPPNAVLFEKRELVTVSDPVPEV